MSEKGGIKHVGQGWNETCQRRVESNMSGEGWNETCQRGVELSQEICYVTYLIYLLVCMYSASRLYIPIQLFDAKRNFPFCPCQSIHTDFPLFQFPSPSSHSIVFPSIFFYFNTPSFLVMHSIVFPSVILFSFPPFIPSFPSVAFPLNSLLFPFSFLPLLCHVFYGFPLHAFSSSIPS